MLYITKDITALGISPDGSLLAAYSKQTNPFKKNDDNGLLVVLYPKTGNVKRIITRNKLFSAQEDVNAYISALTWINNNQIIAAVSMYYKNELKNQQVIMYDIENEKSTVLC